MNERKELIEYRTPNTKHFLNKDGTIEVDIYKQPIHYLNNGEYEEIDNSLMQTSKGFKNKSNDFKIEFDEQNDNSLVNISYQNKTISMFPKNIKQKISNRTNIKETKNILTTNSISYENIYNDVDIDYKILSNQLKESIILNKIPQNNKFTFVINTDLNLILNENNTISFMDKDKEIYRIEKPYMVDNKNIHSYLVKYELEKINNGYEITIDADKNWLNEEERAYPVIIDPTISNMQSSSSVIDKCIYSGPDYLCEVDEQLLAIGTDLHSNKYRTLLKFELPKIPAGYKFVNANVNLACYPATYLPEHLGPLVCIHRLTQDWNENNTTWDNMNNNYATRVEDYYQATLLRNNDPNKVLTNSFNISSLVQKWYNGEPNYGVMLKQYQEIYDENCRIVYYVSKDYNNGEVKPLLQITYKNFNGLESYLSYTSQNHDFGSSHINNYTGNLTSTFTVGNTVGGALPANLYLVYNTLDVELNHNYGYGLGIKPNLIQTIEKETIENLETLKFTDEDGTIHYFYREIIDSSKDPIEYSNKYSDEDGLGLTIELVDENFIMTDKSSNTSKFIKHGTEENAPYYLEEIKDTNNKTIKIIYDNNKISKVIDANNNEINITYEENKITFVSPHLTTEVNLTNNLLTSITSLGITETITYNNNNLIEKITNSNGLAIKYEYISQISYRVKKVSEISKLGNIGNYLTFSYSLDDTKIVDNKGHVNTYIFNNNGNVVGITNLADDNNLNNAYGKSYSFGNAEEGTTNKLIANKSLVKYVDNLIEDPSFENGQSQRFEIIQMDTTNVVRQTDSNNGKCSLEVDIPRGGGAIYQEYKVKKGKKYTFSGYFKGTPLLNDIQNFNIDLSLSYDDQIETTKISKLTENYVRYSVTIDYKENASDNLRVTIRNDNAEPISFNLDDIQLEEGEVANYYNLANNSSLKNGISDWTINKSDLADDFAELSTISADVNALRLHSAPLGHISAEKKFNISGKKGDTFNFSFWYKNDAILPSGGEGIMPGLWATIFFRYPDNTEYGACVPAKYLNIGSDNWQFFSENFTAEDDYEDLTIRINSFGGANDCYVTNFTLFKDLESYSYVYDDNGNLVSAVDLNKESSQMNYNKNNQLISSMSPMGSNYKFEYDSKVPDRLVNAYSPSGITNHIEYDSNGNPIKTRIDNRHQMSEIVSDKTYYIRAKGTNKYFYINPDKSARMKESECSYDKFFIIKNEDNKVKFKHAVLNNYYLKAIGNEIKLMYGDNDNYFELVSDIDGSYFIQKIRSNNEETIKGISYSDTYKLEITDYTEDCNQQFFFEQTDSKLFIESSAQYTEDGRFIKSVKDSLDNVTTYDINPVNGLTNSITDANGNFINYTYDNKLRITNIKQGTHNVDYEYDSNNNLSKIKHGTKNYIFNYDEYNNISNIKINNITLLNKEYEPNNGNLNKIEFGNGNIIEYKRDDFDRIVKIIKQNNEYSNFYDNLGRLTKSKSNTNEYNYKYDFSKRISSFKNNEYKTTFEYDEENNVTKKIENYKGKNEITYNYQYNNDSCLTKLNFINHNNTIDYKYDNLGRIFEKKMSNGKKEYKISYKYITKGNKTNKIINKIIDNGNDYKYVYDLKGNISEIKINEKIIKKYYYDDYNQLLKEDDLIKGEITKYNYDNFGNILSKTTETNNTNKLLSQDIYEYKSSSWQDLLTKFNNETISYDEIGNPIKIGEKNLTWINGRELYSYNYQNNNITYNYNSSGIRTSKSVNGKITEYFTEGTSIKLENRDNNVIHYIYSGKNIIGFIYNNNTYYYHKNIFNDIIGILDSDYNEIVTYEYNSWGAILNITDNSNIKLGTINPFRYRSYYYDEETGLYYLNSRYYNPTWGRFLNADNIILANNDIISCNLFQYTSNNPILHSDPQGNSFLSALGTIAGAIAGMTAGQIAIAVSTVALAAYLMPKAAEGLYNLIGPGVSAIESEISSAIDDIIEDIKRQKNNKDDEKGHNVYILYDESKTIKYVGRTKNRPSKREDEHHKIEGRENLKLKVIAENVTRKEARGLEEAYILGCGTLKPGIPGYNQIHGVSIKNPNRLFYMLKASALASFSDENLIKLENNTCIYLETK